MSQSLGATYDRIALVVLGQSGERNSFVWRASGPFVFRSNLRRAREFQAPPLMAPWLQASNGVLVLMVRKGPSAPRGSQPAQARAARPRLCIRFKPITSQKGHAKTLPSALPMRDGRF